MSELNELIEEAKRRLKRHSELIEKHGTFSWEIMEHVDSYVAEKISASHLREKIRESVDNYINPDTLCGEKWLNGDYNK